MAEQELSSAPLDFNPALPTPGPGTQQPSTDPTYEEAMAALKAKTAQASKGYNMSMNQGYIDSEQTKKYIDREFGFNPVRNNEDFYAQQQGFMGDIGDLAAGVGLKLPALVATKTIGGLGYVLGLVNPTNWVSDDGWIASVADNAISKWATSAEDSIKNEFLPTFQEAADTNKGFFSRAFTDLDFWTGDALDGAAFMASAYIPGMALSKLGAGAKFASVLSKLRLGTNAAGEVVNGLEVAQNYLTSAQKIAKGFDAATTWATATASEAMYEAADVRENVLQSLEGKTNPDTGEEYTDAEKKQIAGGAARNTFFMNTALLGATNAIQMKYMYKALGISESTVGKIAANEIGNTFETVAAKTKWGRFLDSKYGEFAKGVVAGTVSEGYVEENTQLAIQRMNQEYGAQGKVAGISDYFDVIKRAGKQIKDATTGDDQEASMSIGLGALLGGVIGGVGDVKQASRDKVTTQQAINNLNDAQNSWLKFGNLYKTAEEDIIGTDGKPTGEKKSKLVLDDEQQPIVDEAKLADIVSDFSSNVNMLELADKLKDENQAKYLRDMSFRNYVHAHINAGIEDSLMEKLDTASNASAEALAKLGFDPSQKQSLSDYKVLAKKILDQNKLIKNSILRTGPEAEENARINTLTKLADQQSILQGIAKNIDNQVTSIGAQMSDTESSHLSDNAVDSYNAVQYRIDDQERYIKDLESLKASKATTKLANDLLEELKKQRAELVKNNSLSFEDLVPEEDGYYRYKSALKTASPFNLAYQQTIAKRGAYQNAARSAGLEFTHFADTINGLKNFKDYISNEVVAPINTHIQEDEVKENLQAQDAVIDPNSPQVKDLEAKRDAEIENLDDLIPDGTINYVVSLDKDGVVYHDIIHPNGGTKFEDLVPSQLPDGLYDILKQVQDSIKVINDKHEQALQDLGKTSDTSGATATTENTKDFYVFDGKNVKPGQVYSDNTSGEKWMVSSKEPFKVKDIPNIKLELLDAKGNKTGRSTNVASLSGYTLDGTRTTETKVDEKTGEITETPIVTPVSAPTTPVVNGENKFKIQRENEITRIYPYRNTGEKIPDAQKRLDDFLIEFPKSSIVEGLSMTISKPTTKPTSQLAGETVGRANGNLKLNSEFLTVQINSNGLPLGFMTNYTIYSVQDKAGRNVPIEKLTLKQFVEIFDTTGKDPKAAMAKFKKNFVEGRRMFTALQRILGSNESVRVSNEDLNKIFDINISNGEFDFVTDPKTNPGVTLAELPYNTIDGEIYVIDRQRKQTKSGTFITNEIFVKNTTGAADRAIRAQIKQARELDRDTSEQLGRYVAVVKLPNGLLRFVELTTDTWSDEALNDLVAQINTRSELSKKNNLVEKESEKKGKVVVTSDSRMITVGEKYLGGKDETYNDELNNEIARTLFIALPEKNKGTYVDFYVNAMGNLELKFSRKDGNKYIKQKVVVKQEDNTTPLALSNIDELVSKVNKAIYKYNKTASSENNGIIDVILTKDNFKVSLPNTATPEEMMSLRTKLTSNMIKNVGLTYTTKDTIDSVVPAPIKASEPTKATPGIVEIKPPTTRRQTVDVDPVIAANVAAEFARMRGEVSEPTATSIENVDEQVTQISPDPLKTEAVKLPSYKEQSDAIKGEQMEYIVNKSMELQAQGLTSARALIQARKEAEVIYGNRLKELAAKLGRPVLKVTDRATFDEASVEKIDIFRNWVKNNLPEGLISVQEVNDMSEALGKQNITAGMFVMYLDTLNSNPKDIKGRIRVGSNTPFKYHEAFHAVFRLLLNDRQINQLLDISKREVKNNLKKQGITLTKALEDFKGLHSIYKTLSPSELEQRFYEEHLADKFDAWKSNKKTDTSHVAKSWFAKIMDWIRGIFGNKSATELEGLFSDIDNGKYRNSNIQDNYFTREESNMLTAPALKVIKIGEEIVQDENGSDILINRYLSQQESDQIASSIASLFTQRLGTSSLYNKNVILEDILNDYKELYNPERGDNFYESEMMRLFPDQGQEGDMFNYLKKVEDKYNIFNSPENRDSLKESVDVQLRMMGFKQELDTDEFDEAVNEYGDRITTDNWKETHSFGGFGSLSQFLRQYIATTTFEYTDEFGNSLLKEGTPLLQSVNANLVYNGMLKAVANISNQNILMNRLRLLQNQDTETGKFITKFFDDTGIDFNEDSTWFSNKPEKATLIQQVIKGFNQYSVSYIFLNKDISSETKKTHMMYANRRDDSRTQFSIWQNAYVQIFEDQVLKIKDPKAKAEFYSERVEPLNDLLTLMNPKSEISDERLELEAKDVSNLLKNNIGISLSDMFVKYSILSNKDKELLTEPQRTLLNAYENIYYITRDDVTQIIRSIQSGENPFAKNLEFEAEGIEENDNIEGEATEKEKEVGDLGHGGAITRINNIAKGNAVFDENVYSSSFKNAEGELVYSHQLPTFHLVAVDRLNDEQHLEQLRAEPFLENNYLLNNPQFESLSGSIKVERIEGTKSSKLTISDDGLSVRENKQIASNRNQGITYGGFSDREFLSTLTDLYAFGKEKTDINGNKFYTSQHLIRVLESSNTGDTVALPVMRAVELDPKGNVVITDEAAEILYNEVANEAARILRVQQEINSITNPLTDELQDEIDGYHYGTNKDTGKRDYTKGRGLLFYKTGLMLGDLKSSIEQGLINDPSFKLNKSEIVSQIRDYWANESVNFLNLMIDTKVIVKNQADLEAGEKQTYTNKLLDSFIEQGFTTKENEKEVPNERKNSLLNLVPKNIPYNVAQILINDYINTQSFNQLLLGDQAESLKDSVDEVKRAKGANGSGPSLQSYLTNETLGITHSFLDSAILQYEDPLYRAQYAGGNKEKADAQMHGTVKSMRYVLHGLGKLNPFIAGLLDKLEVGQTLSTNEIFGYYDVNGNKVDGLKDLNEMFNSKKLVYYDGKVYIKTSFVMLTKELTSYNDNGEWEALPGKEELHDIRTKLEDFEGRNETVTFAVPRSASKGYKKNIAQNPGVAQDHNFQAQDSAFWRLQLENPSNKLKITDPTQAKQLILAEQDDNLKVDFMGSNTTIGTLKKLYLSDTSQRVKNNYKQARNSIFDIEGAYEELSNSIDLGKVTPKLAKFQARAVEQLRSTGADSQTIDFFSLDENGKPKYNLNNPITLDKYTQLFLAYFSKGVMSEKVPGHSVALMSNYGYKMVKQVEALDENGQPSRWKVIRSDSIAQNPVAYAESKKWNNELDRQFEGLSVGDFYVDDLRHNVPEYDEKGNITGYFSEFAMPPHFRELMSLQPGDTIPEAVLKAFGVRIPSQDKHSAISLKLVDFMPAYYGSTAIFPHELIEISGADFDIDKLYMHIMDTYSKDNKLIAFGTAVSDDEKFQEYIEYKKKNDKDYRNAFREQLGLAKEQEVITDEAEPQQFSSLDELSSLVENPVDEFKVAQAALAQLGLPSTVEEFSKQNKKGELNNGILNNRILEAKLKLINNEHMVKPRKEGEAPIAFEVASVDPLLNEVKSLVKDFSDVPEIMNIVNETAVDTDSLIGKYKSFKNNKEGARNIGPAVNSLLAYTTLSSFHIPLRTSYISGTKESVTEEGKIYTEAVWSDIPMIRLNGHIFSTYSPTVKGVQSLRAYNPVTQQFDGDRIFGSISTVVSAMTDNAKERLAARLGLNIEAVGYLSNMLAQGIAMKTAVRFLLQPTIRKYFDLTKIASNKIKTSEEQKLRKSSILNDLLEEYNVESDIDVDLTDENLDEGLRTNGADIDVQKAVLYTFKTVINQSRNFANVAKVLKLTQGLGTSNDNIDKVKGIIEDLGLRSDTKFLTDGNISIDLRQTFMAKDKERPYHTFMNNYINVLDQIDHLQKTMFLEKTDVFRRIMDVVNDNLNVKNFVKADFTKALKRDLISYLSIKAYMKDLEDTGRYRTLQSLDNAMIYDESAKDKPENFNDIIDTFKVIRNKLPDNYFASHFVNIISTQRTNNDNESALNELNRDGINKAEANTWAKLSEYQTEKIKDSFLEIYQNDATRENAVDIFNYILVKDAGQFKSNSFIRFIPTFMFKDLLKATDRVNEVLKLDAKATDKQYQDLFGVAAVDLYDQFMKSYTSHISNRSYLRGILNMKPGYGKSEFKSVTDYVPQSFSYIKKETKLGETTTTKERININIFNGIRTGSKEAWDTGTNQGIIYLDSQKGSYTKEEKGKFAKNIEFLRSKGFDKYQQGSDFAFPYVMVDATKGDRAYYKLISVQKAREKGEKVVKAEETDVASRLINKGETIARGIGAIYERFEPTGSSKSTAIGELFGAIPVLPKAPRARKGFNNRGEYSLENLGRFSNKSASEIEASMGLTNEDSKPVILVTTKTRTFNSDKTVPPGQILSQEYGIEMKVTNRGVIFKGDIWDRMSDEQKASIKTPMQLLNMLGYSSDMSQPQMPTSAENSNIPEYRDIPLPDQELSGAYEIPDDIEEEDTTMARALANLPKGSDPAFMANFFKELRNSNDAASETPLDDNCA